MKLLVREQRWAEAVEAFHTLEPASRSMESYCVVLGALAAAQDWAAALDLEQQMRAQGHEANNVTHAHVLKALGSAGEWQRAVYHLNQMVNSGFAADILHYNSVLSSIGNSG